MEWRLADAKNRFSELVTRALVEGTMPDDPARSAEQEELRTGVEPAAAQRARIREGKSEAGVRGRQIIPSDPHEGP